MRLNQQVEVSATLRRQGMFCNMHLGCWSPEESLFILGSIGGGRADYRGNGAFTKDAIYLRGPRDVESHPSERFTLEPLLVDKIALHHFSEIHEFRQRGDIQPPRLLPRYLTVDNAQRRLASCRGNSFTELIGV